MPVLTSSDWDTFLAQCVDAHILQSITWGELKQAFGWDVEHVAILDDTGSILAGAQILFRKFLPGLCMAYLGRGPVGPANFSPTHPKWPDLMAEIDTVCRKRRAIFLKIEPDLWEPLEEETSADAHQQNPPQGFLLSDHTIQPARTLLVDIRGEEQQVLARMKQKTRYNIRLAQKKGVVVTPSLDIAAFYRLMQSTGDRDAFGVHSLEYYRRAFQLFQQKDACQLLIAEFQGEPLAAVMVFAQGKRAWYFYGASSDAHRDLMPSYLVQWEAMRWARGHGCELYDLWGVPDEDEKTLEDGFMQNQAGLWGVYRFKRGFGGVLRRAQGPWDRVYNPVIYSAYRWWMNQKQQNHDN